MLHFYTVVSGAPISVSSTAVLQSITTNTSSITTNVSSNNTAISASYAPQAGSFAVVPSSNRNIVNNTTSGMISSSVVQQSGSQPIPVRFNPQLIVDGNKEASSYDGLIQKQLGHQQVSFVKRILFYALFSFYSPQSKPTELCEMKEIALMESFFFLINKADNLTFKFSDFLHTNDTKSITSDE